MSSDFLLGPATFYLLPWLSGVQDTKFPLERVTFIEWETASAVFGS